VRDEFVLSASDNWITPSVPMLFSALNENEVDNKCVTIEIERIERCV
jgi:hypothetical protein